MYYYSMDINISAVLFLISAIIVAVNTKKTHIRVVSIIAASISFLQVFMENANMYAQFTFSILYYSMVITTVGVLLYNRKRRKEMLVSSLVFYCIAAFFAFVYFTGALDDIFAFIGSLLFMIFTIKVAKAISYAKKNQYYNDIYNQYQNYHNQGYQQQNQHRQQNNSEYYQQQENNQNQRDYRQNQRQGNQGNPNYYQSNNQSYQDRNYYQNNYQNNHDGYNMGYYRNQDSSNNQDPFRHGNNDSYAEQNKNNASTEDSQNNE